MTVLFAWLYAQHYRTEIISVAEKTMLNKLKCVVCRDNGATVRSFKAKKMQLLLLRDWPLGIERPDDQSDRVGKGVIHLNKDIVQLDAKTICILGTVKQGETAVKLLGRQKPLCDNLQINVKGPSNRKGLHIRRKRSICTPKCAEATDRTVRANADMSTVTVWLQVNAKCDNVAGRDVEHGDAVAPIPFQRQKLAGQLEQSEVWILQSTRNITYMQEEALTGSGAWPVVILVAM